jgi:hypothetical protein
MTEEDLIAVFDVVLRDDTQIEYLAASAFQVLADWRPSLLDAPVFLRRMAEPHVPQKDLTQVPFSKRFLPVVTERRPRPQQKVYTTCKLISYYDMLTESAIQSILQWLTVEHSNMAALERF